MEAAARRARSRSSSRRLTRSRRAAAASPDPLADLVAAARTALPRFALVAGLAAAAAVFFVLRNGEVPGAPAAVQPFEQWILSDGDAEASDLLYDLLAGTEPDRG